MKICIVENNLAGFLTAIYDYYYTYKDIDLITSDRDKATMLDEIIETKTDIEKAAKVRSGIIKKVNAGGYKDISDTYMSCDTDKEQKLFLYLKLLFKEGMKTFSMFSDSAVIAFNDMKSKVWHEVHRMHGFIRFQEMASGIFYSYFGSDNDILELILPHFITRFNNQKFVLHDIKRKKMAYFDGKSCETFVAPEGLNVPLSDNEMLFSKLWKEYYQNVTIGSRVNVKLQNRFAPKKYRWFMNEF